MRLHVEWATGFSLCFVFSDAPALSRALLQRFDDAWRFRTAPVELIEPADPTTAAQRVFAALQAHHQTAQGLLAPAWLQLAGAGSAWDAARTECLARLNEGREWLVKDYARPLVLCLPLDWQSQVAPVAPDLWHVRSYTAALQSWVPHPGLRVQGGNLQLPAVEVAGGVWQSTLPRQLELVNAARARLATGNGDDARRELAIELVDLAQAQLEVGRHEAACASAKESLRLMRQLSQALGDRPQVLRELSVSLDRSGDAESAAGRGEAALEAYRESLALRRQLRQALGEGLQVLRDLSVSLNKVGDAESTAGRGEAALEAYRESLALSRQLRQVLGDGPQVLRDLSVSLLNWGEAESAAGRGEAALEAYRESLALSRELRQALGEGPQVLRDLSVSLIKVGDAESAAGRGEAALEAYRESLALSRELRQALGDSPQVLDDLAVSLERLASAPTVAAPDKRAAIAEALQLRKRLVLAQPGSAYQASRLDTSKRIEQGLDHIQTQIPKPET